MIGALTERSRTTLQRARAIWHEKDLRWLLLSQTISTTGDRIALVALSALVIDQSGSVADLGIVIGAQSAALVAFLLLGGVWADRLPRHRMMLATDICRAALHGAVAVLILAGSLDIWVLVAVELIFGAAEAFSRPAFTGLLPQTVPESMIQEANAANSLCQTVAQFVGPALAVGVVVVAGTAAAFAADAVTFLVSAALLRRLRPRPRGSQPPAARTSFRDELREGFHEVRTRPWIWVTILVFSVHQLIAYVPYMVLGPKIAADQYGSAASWGWVFAAVGLGTAIGAVAGMSWRPRRPLVTGLGVVIPFGGLVALAAQGAAIALVLSVAVAAGAGIALFMVWWPTALAQHVPPTALSRVGSIDYMGSFALLPIGFVGVGFLADAFGAIEVMTVGGAIALLLPLVAMLPRDTRRLMRLDTGARDEASPTTVRATVPIEDGRDRALALAGHAGEG